MYQTVYQTVYHTINHILYTVYQTIDHVLCTVYHIRIENFLFINGTGENKRIDDQF